MHAILPLISASTCGNSPVLIDRNPKIVQAAGGYLTLTYSTQKPFTPAAEGPPRALAAGRERATTSGAWAAVHTEFSQGVSDPGVSDDPVGAPLVAMAALPSDGREAAFVFVCPAALRVSPASDARAAASLVCACVYVQTARNKSLAKMRECQCCTDHPRD
jgi:hypothetical protein